MARKKYTKEIILKAAYDLSKHVGLNDLSMRSIAKKIGCSVVPIYEEFDSKENLVNELSTLVIQETIFDADTLMGRFKNLFEYGMRYPKFLLSFGSYPNTITNDPNVVKKVIDIMRTDTRLNNRSDDDVLALNSRLEALLLGYIFNHQNDKFVQSHFIELYDAFKETLDFIIEGYNKVRPVELQNI